MTGLLRQEAAPSLIDLVDMFGTPAYVYDLATVRAACRDLEAALPERSRIYFSVKANPHPLVGAELAALGCHAEVSSTGEITAAVSAGFAPERIMMNGPAKSRDALDLAFGHGIRRFSVDSPVDLDRLAERAVAHGTTAEYVLRVNADTPVPGMGLSMTGTSTQFGTDASAVRAAPEEFLGRPGAAFTGFHLYMGTQIEDQDVLVRQFTASIRLANQLQRVLGVPLREMDLGGGFGMPYAHAGARPVFADLRRMVTATLDAELPGWRCGEPIVSFESGRYLAGGCGRLLCRVQDVKTSKGLVYVVLDTGINHLGGMSGLRRVPRIVPDLVPVAAREGTMADCAVVGPLCTPLDTWCRGVTLPRLEPGDLLTVPNVGAYGLTAGMLAFLSHPAAAELVVDGDRLVSASRLALRREPLGSPGARHAPSASARSPRGLMPAAVLPSADHTQES